MYFSKKTQFLIDFIFWRFYQLYKGTIALAREIIRQYHKETRKLIKFTRFMVVDFIF
jgi:hypothetical protein